MPDNQQGVAAKALEVPTFTKIEVEMTSWKVKDLRVMSERRGHDGKKAHRSFLDGSSYSVTCEALVKSGQTAPVKGDKIDGTFTDNSVVEYQVIDVDGMPDETGCHIVNLTLEVNGGINLS